MAAEWDAKQIAAYNNRKPSPREREQSDTKLERDGFPMSMVTDAIRLEVLRAMGLRPKE